MKHIKLRFGEGFRVVFSNPRAQMAEMVLAPGDKEGDPANRHKRADQWLYVVAGSGMAIVNGRRIPLRTGVLVLIEHKDRVLLARLVQAHDGLRDLCRHIAAVMGRFQVQAMSYLTKQVEL